MSTKAKPSPSTATSSQIKGLSTAPFIYFDAAPMLGTFAGNLEVELAARVLAPRPDGNVVAEAVCVAHLRMPPRAAQELVDALTKALDFMRKDKGDREQQPKAQLDS